MAILTKPLSCHAVLPFEVISSDKVFPETSCRTAHAFITEVDADTYARAPDAIYVLNALDGVLHIGHFLTLLAHEKHGIT